MKKHFKVKRLGSFLFIMFGLAVFFKDSLFSYASKLEQNTFIRVGLVKEFKEKNSLQIKNRDLVLGFSKKDEFHPLERLKSEKGLIFRKKTGRFFEISGEFNSFYSAKKEAKRLGDEKTFIPVFVGIKEDKGRWKIFYTGGFSSLEQMGSEVRREKDFLQVEGEGLNFFIDAKEAEGYPQFEAANHLGEKLIFLENKKYRGRMEIGSYRKNGVTAVNVVRMEDYVRGVVPLEMGYTWHLSAMKAQAVAARSFALATAGFKADSDIEKGYRLNNISHQSYGGYDVEGEKPDRACRETVGEFLIYKNKVVRAFYYSTSGGSTEKPENVWGSKKAYLQTVPDLFESKPEKKAWTSIFKKESLKNLLTPIASRKGSSLGDVLAFQMEDFSESERLIRLKVVGSLGEMTLSKNEIRTVFDLPSTKFRIFSSGEEADRVSILYGKNGRLFKKKKRLKGLSVLTKKGLSKLSYQEENGGQAMVLSAKNRKGFYLGEIEEDSFAFVGTGFGHGVGMSQSGANGMAKAGYGYKKILMHYYRGAVVR